MKMTKMKYGDLLAMANAYGISSGDLEAAEAVADIIDLPDGKTEWTDEEFESLCAAIRRICGNYDPGDYGKKKDCYDVANAVNSMMEDFDADDRLTLSELLDGSKDDAIVDYLDNC